MVSQLSKSITLQDTLGGSNPEGRFYFPNRYRRFSKKEPIVEQQEPGDEKTLRKVS